MPFRPVPQDKAVDHEIALDRFDGASDARVARRQKADQRDHQQTGIEILASIVLYECIALMVETAATHLLMDRRA